MFNVFELSDMSLTVLGDSCPSLLNYNILIEKCGKFILKYYIDMMIYFHIFTLSPSWTGNDVNVCLITVLSMFRNFIFSCRVCDIKT